MLGYNEIIYLLTHPLLLLAMLVVGIVIMLSILRSRIEQQMQPGNFVSMVAEKSGMSFISTLIKTPSSNTRQAHATGAQLIKTQLSVKEAASSSSTASTSDISGTTRVRRTVDTQ